jgi:hypothetical protein
MPVPAGCLLASARHAGLIRTSLERKFVGHSILMRLDFSSRQEPSMGRANLNPKNISLHVAKISFIQIVRLHAR